MDNKTMLWSQQPLQGVDSQQLQSWLERFIDDIEHQLEQGEQESEVEIGAFNYRSLMKV